MTATGEAAAFASVAARPLLADAVVVVTGATGGIGRAVARLVAAAGARVAITDLGEEPVRELAAELGAVGEACDATSLTAFGDFHARVETELGPLDGIVNCAGLWVPAPYDAVTDDDFEATVAANLKTAFVACRAVLPGMVARGGGSIVNFASTAGEYGSIRPAAHYAAAKGGVIALTKSLAREVSPAGVRVNAVSPGPTDTPALLAATPEQRAVAGSRTLFGRLGQPYEIAGACVFLLSPLSTFVTGTVLQVNGGALL
ncbi:MAG TPA: SDR family NAD(P)-dependent oxidoreductase [Gaiellaceae bacterium]|nr:SDR family NAD(P)-dependent oxidoreductase [Gaiellaceae bacterium]